ncbi:hypothetical protein TSUD_42920 [Trifolium subterraneum]|uniref:Uncharacterized protein n=1 Tax=Trifolium subterraneum TaxID=3900 RepID=A0A2Z6LHM4_TRISU|nr:hypothetical protein TSUD_42920 [Trifolium subterraneum]
MSEENRDRGLFHHKKHDQDDSDTGYNKTSYNDELSSGDNESGYKKSTNYGNDETSGGDYETGYNKKTSNYSNDETSGGYGGGHKFTNKWTDTRAPLE